MTDVYKAPFGTYTGAQVCAAAGQAEIIANLASFLALFGVTLTGSTAVSYVSTAAHPDFNKIDPATREKIAKEILNMAATIDAMPTA